MQYFSIIARHGDGYGRTCAMLQDSTLSEAAEKASAIIRAEHLNFVRKNSTFSIRKSSRRETSLLQAYLRSCAGPNLKTYTREDIDGLLARRNSLLLSFFMALYIDPVKLRERLETPETGDADDLPDGAESSGGVAIAPAPAEAQVGETPEDEMAVPVSDELPAEEEVAGEDAPIGDDSQIAAMAAILDGGTSSSEAGDDFLDLD